MTLRDEASNADCLLLGVDIGTLSTKGVITDLRGRVLAERTAEHAVREPQMGWAEHDATDDWWGGFLRVVRALKDAFAHCLQDVAVVGVSGLFPCLCLADAQGEPLHRAILYSDKRADDELEEARDVVGMPVRADGIAPKLIWLSKHHQDLLRRARYLFNSYDYVVFRLAGRRALDYKTASSLGRLYDEQQSAWREDVFRRLGVSASILPTVRQPFEVVGEVTGQAAQVTGLKVGTPVVVGTADTLATQLGAGVIHRGDAMVYYGTTGTLIACKVDLVESFAQPQLVGPDVPYALGTYSLAAGAALQWFRDEFGAAEQGVAHDLRKDAYQLLDEEAANVSAGADGLIVLPSFLGERWPEPEPAARATVFGLTLSHTRAHIYRALLESYGYDVRRGVLSLQERGIPIRRVVAVGGGARSDLWCQIVSDIIGLPQQHLEHAGASLGDAFLAGYGLGLFQDISEVESWLRTEAVTRPRPEAHAIYTRLFAVSLQLRNALKGCHRTLAESAPADGFPRVET